MRSQSCQKARDGEVRIKIDAYGKSLKLVVLLQSRSSLLLAPALFHLAA